MAYYNQAVNIGREFLKQQEKKHEVTYKGISITLTANFFVETLLGARKEWDAIFTALSGKIKKRLGGSTIMSKAILYQWRTNKVLR